MLQIYKMIMKFIHLPTFIISLAFGIFLVYISVPPVKVIQVYPTPDNVDEIQYKDESGVCYGFKAKEVACKSAVKNKE